jgi:hypothetical protein
MTMMMDEFDPDEVRTKVGYPPHTSDPSITRPSHGDGQSKIQMHQDVDQVTITPQYIAIDAI